MRILIFILVLFSAHTQAKNIENVESLSKRIEINVTVGSTILEVDDFLIKSTWLYDYDRFSKRYQARTIDGASECSGRNFFLWLLYDCGIQIYLNFDEQEKYSGYSVEQIYSGL